MTIQEITDILQEWFIERIHMPLDCDENFVKSSRFDSFDIVELVAFSEKRFGCTFSANDLESAHFATLSGLASLIEANLRGVEAPKTSQNQPTERLHRS